MLLVIVLLTLAAWRLSRGPVDLGFLTGRLEAALNADGAPTRIEVGGIALAWEGFHKGLDRPLDLRLRDIKVVDDAGRVRLLIPQATATLSMAGLLLGRVEPRAVELDGMRLTATRGADNTIGIDVGSLTEATDSPAPGGLDAAAVLEELMRPAMGDARPRRNVLSQMRRIRLRNLELRAIDHVVGITWTASRVELDLSRRAGGGIDLTGSAELALRDQHTTLSVTAASSADRASIDVRFSLGAVVPAALKLPGLDAIDAPVSAEGSATLSAAFALISAKANMNLGAGTLHAGTGTVPIRRASVALSATPASVTLDSLRVVLPGSDGRPDTTLSVTGTATVGAQRVKATLNLGLDRVAVADLPRLWPDGVGGGARPWLLTNITAGFVHDGRVTLTMEANRDLSDLALSGASGTFDGDDLTVFWLRPVAPLEHGHAHIRIVDPDTIDIAVVGGRQRVGNRTPLVVTGGSLHIVGMTRKDQFADIAIQTNGPFADVIALLREPRLKLLSTHPIDLRDPAGEVTASLKINLPLDNKLTMDDVGIDVVARVRQGHLSNVAAGRDLDKAELDIAANKDRLTLKGTGQIGGIATTIDGSMNFQTGGPRDIVQRIAVTAKASVRQLAAAGLDVGDLISGEFPLSAVWTQQRTGGGAIALDADLTGAVVTVAPLAWRKAAGIPLRAAAKLHLSGDHLSGIEGITADGTSITVRASAEIVNNRIAGVRLDHLVFGLNDLVGTVRLPPGGPIAVVLNGPSLDLAAKLKEKTASRDQSKPEPPPGPRWTLSSHFARTIMANGVIAQDMEIDAVNDGRIYTRLRIGGATPPAARFSIAIERQGGARRIVAAAADAGAFLRGLDAIRTMQGGALSLSGSFDDSKAAHPLNGTAEVTDYRVRDAPALGRLLQAMTLYGLVDVVRGPGLAFARLTAPFVLSDANLEFRDARAFSPSLGMTAKGHLDIHADTADIQGTIVPAYFFNSLLGKIPFVGGLFRSEEGGGLFAANYTIKGPLSDPSVSVNPLSILTPGILRRIFGGS